MPPIYIPQQGAKLRINKCGLHISITKEDGTIRILSEVPIRYVSQIVLFGNIGLTIPAIQSLRFSHIDVVFLPHDGRYCGQINGGIPLHVPLR